MKVELEGILLRALFDNAYFINGTAYAGKSTMVRLLAKRHDGIECGENYHNALMHLIDAEHQPNLNYFSVMSGWDEYFNRTPEQFDAWIQAVAQECAQLEIIELIRLSTQRKPMFVDTNISPTLLHAIARRDHVAIMLSPQSMSVERFFDRSDPDKQFMLSRIQASKDPEATMRNFRMCLERINSKEHYDEFLYSGFEVFTRDETTTIDGMLAKLEAHFGLPDAKTRKIIP